MAHKTCIHYFDSPGSLASIIKLKHYPHVDWKNYDCHVANFLLVPLLFVFLASISQWLGNKSFFDIQMSDLDIYF